MIIVDITPTMAQNAVILERCHSGLSAATYLYLKRKFYEIVKYFNQLNETDDDN